MIHMILELLVSSMRICVYTSERLGACAGNGSAASRQSDKATAWSLDTVPPELNELRFARTRMVRAMGSPPGGGVEEELQERRSELRLRKARASSRTPSGVRRRSVISRCSSS